MLFSALNRRARCGFAALTALLAVGCVPEASDTVRLRAAFWSPPGVMEAIAQRFEAEHPGVKVDLLITGGRYAEKLQSMIVAGNEPDVIMVHDTFYHDWAARDVLLDLSPFVKELHAEDPFMPGPMDALTWRGRAYAVPADTNAMVTFGNLDVAAAVGLPFPWEQMTWQELAAWGPRLSRRDNPSSPTEYLCALPAPPFFFTAFGARCFDDAHAPTAVVADSPVTIAAIDYWRQMHQRGWAVPRSTVLDQGESEMFRDGRIAFLFWGRGVLHIVKRNPERRFDIAPVPAGPTAALVPHLTVGLGISRRSKQVELAKAFIRFCISDAGIEIPVRGGQMVPARRRQVYGDFFLQQTPPASTRRFAEPLEAGAVAAVVYAPGRPTVEDLIAKRFEQALAEPATPSSDIAAGLAADLRVWLANLQRKGLL